MTPFRNRLTPLTRRMAEDMQVRNLSPRTIDSYTWHVDKFTQHFGRPAEELGPLQPAFRRSLWSVVPVHQGLTLYSSYNERPLEINCCCVSSLGCSTTIGGRALGVWLLIRCSAVRAKVSSVA